MISITRSRTMLQLRAVADRVLHQKRLSPDDNEYLSGFSMDTAEPALPHGTNLGY